MKGIIDDLSQYPGFRTYWELRRHQFSASFRAHIDDAIVHAAARAKPLYR
jgi:hypothetical protein